MPRHAIVLAAGESRRMGQPKALLDVDGVPLVALHAARFAEAACDAIVVATRPELLEAVRDALRDVPRCTVVGARTTSQGDTLRVAAAAIEARVGPDDVVFVTPVDLLPPGAGVLVDLARALDAGSEAATPRRDGRGGHPVAMRASSLLRFAASPGETNLREHLAAMGEARAAVDVDDDRILGDLDTPDHVERAALTSG